MSCSKAVLKRARPLLGTIFEISVGSLGGDRSDVATVVTRAFEYASRLEAALSKFSVSSWPNRFNRWDGRKPFTVPDEIFPVFQLAFEMYRDSGGAFDPFLPDGNLDLTGVAKGWIVDQVAEFLARELATREICVNGGGDLRFVNVPTPEVAVRIAGGFRRLPMRRSAVAVSSMGTRNPSTAYHKSSMFAGEDSVCVMHDSCAVADALTKAVLFSPDVRALLARYNAEYVVVGSDEAVPAV